MISAKSLLAGFACAAVLLGSLEASAHAEANCKEPEDGAKGTSIISPRLANVVTGTGRLQFYSAPNKACEMKGVFVIPKDKVISYVATDDGWTSVMYLNPRTGDDVQGWVRSERLKATGTMGPKD